MYNSDSKTMAITFSMIVLVLIGAFPTLAAQSNDVLVLSAWIYKNDSVVLNDIYVSKGKYDEANPNQDTYLIQVVQNGKLRYSSYFPIFFEILTEPPTEVDRILLSRNLPYFGNNASITIYKEGSLIFEYDLNKLCDNNGSCDKFENHLSCPYDCPLNQSDKLCIPSYDGSCDPDCAQGIDPDCAANTTPAPTPVVTTTPSPFIFIGVVAILAIFMIVAVVFIRRIRKLV